ncbi:hypothetical protein SLV14_005654 [Streptomyces sp. Je 1-4]|uniref:hypothetical protein n=1 Tax=Streptomyces TaxID=1883 RepID=UPI00140EB4A7|nr:MULTISPECIES: hypothetical protein [unclassified Streptomyces]QIK09052.1 hypothetical protein G7Z12_26560 [Streptomyces sp. ID38640]UYB42747.1 hypothetical protein SLV14_005654 [Streptomyces sp. Je 1-4]UZQ39077.1 hypothetical protein SLV14N_005654 [Streptomyces sp. Je 1-4] [Streptomyces sp. Je 1-4 4N24]UZQ46494.1 hypothetical protein SLV14NA_005654 [Streptomyces sp. Je 1-4] [Streptomyces sp. Je 1-4 4N24_ara]
MDAVRVALLREVLAGTEWIQETRRFAGALRGAVVPHGGGLLLVGSTAYEPWHLAAHLDDEAAWSGLPELSPTLVRHRVPGGAPAHLAVGLGRLAAAGRGETLLVVAPGQPGAGLLERVHDARRNGATVLALDGGDRDLHALAHDALAAPPAPPDEPAAAAPDLDLDTVQHLVSAAAGENSLPAPRGRRRFRDRLARLADGLTAPPPPRW